MPRISKIQFTQQVDAIRQRILHKEPFEKQLAHLYTQLRLYTQYNQLIQAYQLLCLYLPEQEHIRLYHSALLQAFLITGDIEQAKHISQILYSTNPQDPETNKLRQSVHLQTGHMLTPYTPLVNISHYARKTGSKAAKTAAKLPPSINEKLLQVTPSKLQQMGYIRKHKQLSRISRPYRPTAQKLFDEIILNYLLQNSRSVAVLSGAFLELLLASYFHDTLGIKHIPSSVRQHKDIFSCNLNELIAYATKKQCLTPATLHLCRAARLQRNFIHPGKEIAGNAPLTANGMQVCFLAVMEIIDELLQNKPRERCDII